MHKQRLGHVPCPYALGRYPGAGIIRHFPCARIAWVAFAGRRYAAFEEHRVGSFSVDVDLGVHAVVYLTDC